jgi:poly(glycerol-phosphate) alpha-glucosyltransferase
MTRAMLHRSRAFVRLAGAEVDVLTFDTRPDYPELEARLRRDGELVDGMRLLNLWDWLREHPVDPQGEPEAIGALPRTGDGLLEQSTEQVDVYRRDGSLLAIDRRGEQRTITLHDGDGLPVRTFPSAWALYRWWLDALRERQQTTIIVDSKTVARFATSYRRKRAVVVHVLHNSHLGPDGQLRASRREVLEHLDAFDTAIALSERQAADLRTRVPGRVAVIPNATDRVRRRGAHRDQTAGLVVASLDGRKRVGHAVRAAQAAGVHLDVFGDGPQRARLEQSAGSTATWHGHSPEARHAYATASFLLLTSKAEGFPLVLLESMANGCLPIAYDVDYGPGDLIRDGVNGYLVPEGDIGGLADAIRRLLALPSWQRALMRQQARRTAAEYSDRRIVRRWATELQSAHARHRAEWAARQAG